MPMTIAFMALLAAVTRTASTGRRSRAALAACRCGNREHRVVDPHGVCGAGDLRPGALVQFLPMLLCR
jgi:hypothetical protein